MQIRKTLRLLSAQVGRLPSYICGVEALISLKSIKYVLTLALHVCIYIYNYSCLRNILADFAHARAANHKSAAPNPKSAASSSNSRSMFQLKRFCTQILHKLAKLAAANSGLKASSREKPNHYTNIITIIKLNM